MRTAGWLLAVGILQLLNATLHVGLQALRTPQQDDAVLSSNGM